MRLQWPTLLVLYKVTNITKVLMDRISAESSVVDISKTRDDLFILRYYTNLCKSFQVLQNLNKYVKEITQYNTEQEVLKTIEKKVKDLCMEYDDSISLLNFVDFKEFNAQDEDKVLRDVEELLKL